MQTIDGQLLYSATDLVGFLACTHLTNLDCASVAGLVQRPMRADPELDRIAKRGLQHEARFRDGLVAEGRTVTEILPDASIADPGDKLRQAVQRTHEAMHRGDDIIYQAALSDGRRRGHPDFLIKIDTPSSLGDWSYEVWDTKLARSAKGSAVLQLCLYSDLLEIAQGLKPVNMYVALGGREQQKVPLRFDDYAAYYRLVSSDFEKLVFGDAVAAYPPPSRPDPVEHCDVCRWSEVCRKELRRTDDLSLVAGITANQRRQLRERKVPTRSALATLTLPLEPPLKGNAQSLRRVREQARIQVEGQAAGSILSERLDPSTTRDGELEARGLLSLPPPSDGDLFFDIEGDPFALDEGVDYLFGVLEPRLRDDKGQPVFHSFWSIDDAKDVTPEAERKAFEAFIDLVMDRLELNPDLHVYHYAPYEPTAVKRLMGRYGTREEAVDRLLRGGVFVDLFHAARQGIRASVESYSIKRLEPLYGFNREVDLRDAGSSIAAFETWLELGGEVEGDPAILDRIEEYNKDDCVSTWLLRDWLEAQRHQLAVQMQLDLPRPNLEVNAPGQDLSQALAQTQAAVDQLLLGVPDDASKRTADQQGRWLLAQLLSWHRREEKSTWWRYFYLKDVLTDEDRITEPDALGGLIFLTRLRQEVRSYIYRFSFPAQEFKIGVGDKPHDPLTGNPVGTVVEIDELAGTIDIKRGMQMPAPEATSLIPLDHVDAKPMREALLRLGEWVVGNGIGEAGLNLVGRELLLRKPPRFGQEAGAGLAQPGEMPDEAARRLVRRLDSSYLAIQGPPGSGKTSVGAEMIVDLVAAGKRVGVTAGSHKVIGHLLKEAARAAERRNVPLRVGQRAAIDEAGAYEDATLLLTSEKARDAVLAGDFDVVGGTTWLWCREDMQAAVDVLFVDEAGQMSLANVIAAASGATNLVLLGDPQQLDQPLKGVHPPGADKSALAHILGEHPTMPPDLGLFLDGTWRLHPGVCEYTSKAFYEGRLSSRPGREGQDVAGFGVLSGTGIRFIPVSHTGHSSDSEEEALVLAHMLDDLFGHEPAWTDDKGVEQPLSMKDVLVVTPYNAQVRTISELIPGVQVGTVDKFQGQEAAIAIYSMATSSADEAPRGMEFLYSLNRLNVATSRARCLAVVIASPDLVRVRCRTPRQMRLANALARLVEIAQAQTPDVGSH